MNVVIEDESKKNKKLKILKEILYKLNLNLPWNFLIKIKIHCYLLNNNEG